MHRLTHLTLSNLRCKGPLFCWQQSDVFRHCTALQVLRVNGCHGIADIAIRGIPSTLRELDISQCRRLTDGGVSHLTSLRGLTMLDNIQITNATLRAMPDLRSLHIGMWGPCALTAFAFDPLIRLTSLHSGGLPWGLRGCAEMHMSNLAEVRLAWEMRPSPHKRQKTGT